MGIVLVAPTLDVSGKKPVLQFPSGAKLVVSTSDAFALLGNAEVNGAALVVSHRMPKTSASGRRHRRSEEELSHDLERITTLLKSNKKTGLNAQALSAKLKLDREALAGPIAMGLKSKRISKKGQKRATVYFFKK